MSGHCPSRQEAVILFMAGDTRFAIAAAAVEEICSLDGLAPLAQRGRANGVAHALERRGHRYLVVDANFHFEMLSSKPERVLVLCNSAVAILVGSVDRMQMLTAIHALPQGFRGEERQWYRGLACLPDGVVPVINPASFINKANRALLAMQLPAPVSNLPAPGGACA